MQITPLNALLQGHWGQARAQGITAGANAVSWILHCPSILLNCPIFIQFSDSHFHVHAFSLCPTIFVCSPFCGQIQKSFQRCCSIYRHSVCTHGCCCSSFFQLPFLLCELEFVLNFHTLSWLQSTGQVVVSEWLWAFIIAFHSRNFLFSSQEKCYPPCPAEPVAAIQSFLQGLLCRKGCKWTQTPEPWAQQCKSHQVLQSLFSICKCSWLCCPAQICQLPLSDSRFHQQNWTAQELAQQEKLAQKWINFIVSESS